MPKRRRERDRPKAGPDAPYNPNERIVLSYDSEEHEDNLPSDSKAKTVEVGITHNHQSTTQMSTGKRSSMPHDPPTVDDESDYAPLDLPNDNERSNHAGGPGTTHAYGDEEEEASHGRHYDHANAYEVDGAYGDDQAYYDDDYFEEEDDGLDPSTSKDARHKVKGPFKGETKKAEQDERQEAYEDFGMRPMFLPSMARTNAYEDGEDDEYDSETDEAMAYLTAVQNERRGIPSLLTVPQHIDIAQYAAGASASPEDLHGTFHDGVYAARPAAPTELTPEEQYLNAVTAGYRQVREQLKQPLTDEEIAGCDETVFIDEVPYNNKEFDRCRRILLETPPSTAQLKEMSTETAWELLELVLMKFGLRQGQEITQTVGLWLYMLLARLEDKLDVSVDQIGTLRTLAKQAVHVRDSVRSTVSRTRTDEQLDLTQTTVDSVLIIIGNYYSQRDMLEYRLWPPT